MESGSSVFSPSLNAGVGAVGVTNDIHLLKCSEKVAREQGAHLLRFLVVGVIIAGAQSIGAQQDAPLDFGSEADVPRLRDTSLSGYSHPWPESRSALHQTWPGWHWPRRSPAGSRLESRTWCAAANRVDDASCLAQTFDRGLHRSAHLGIEAVAKIFSRNTHAQALHRLLQSA